MYQVLMHARYYDSSFYTLAHTVVNYPHFIDEETEPINGRVEIKSGHISSQPRN